MKKIIKYFTLNEWIFLILSTLTIIFSFFIFKTNNVLYLIASIIGCISLSFNAKGNAIGQFLMIIFSILYGIISYYKRYYGEMITYILMTGLVSLLSMISWIKNPSKESKSVVKINNLKVKEYILMSILSLIVTIVFYFILKALNTDRLILSTISVLTSFLACYLSLRRSKYYAVAYAINDIVLIILWILAANFDIKYISIVICFIFFLINDIYGYICWHNRQKNQK